uniref:Cysteine-rich transmembrane CYSTM domain-containing protein n=1 Tax=Parascaris univalens TaxID=6257 RepID=A0A915CHR3_PARUN
MSAPPPYQQQPYGQAYPAQPGFSQVAYGYPGQQQAYYPPNPQGYPPQGYPQQTYPPQGYGYPQPQVVTVERECDRNRSSGSNNCCLWALLACCCGCCLAECCD